MTDQNRTSQRSEVVRSALSVVDLATKATEAYQRPDLADRVAAARDRLEDPSITVLVVGEFKKGKSSLVNALLNAPVCPVDDDIATARPTIVRYAEEAGAAVLWDDEQTDERRPPTREVVPFEQVADYVTDLGGTQEGRRVRAVEIGIPRRLLAGGLVLVDTPGVGGLGSAHSAATIGALPMADAVVFVTDASQEFSAPELEFLETARSMCPNLVCLLSKIDFYPSWRKILDLDRNHLATAGIPIEILPVSSTLRLHAISSDDRELNAESGFSTLVSHLQQNVVANAETIGTRAAMSDVVAVGAQLAAQFEAERAALADPERAEALVARLEQAKVDADRLRGQAARWQQTLNDGIQDLIADVDHDLRQRFRIISRQADEAIESTDPATTWGEFEPWLYRRVAEDVTSNYSYLQIRAAQLSELVADHFDIARDEITLRLDIRNPTSTIDAVEVEAGLEAKKITIRQQGMTGLKGGYSGVLMFTLLGSFAGIALGPVAIVAGLLMGRKAVKDEKERQLTLRRQQAKNSHRRYTDEVSFLVGKDSRDALRQIQRSLRDHYSTRAEELHRSTAETLQAAQDAVRTDQQGRQKRQRDVEAELGRVASLRERALALAPDLAPTAPAS